MDLLFYTLIFKISKEVDSEDFSFIAESLKKLK